MPTFSAPFAAGSSALFATTPTTSPEALALLKTLLASGALQTVSAQTSFEPTTPLTTAQNAIAGIPIAHDGDVIGADFHNSLRTALAALLEEVGVGRGPVAPIAPAFREQGASPIWIVNEGIAVATVPVAGGGINSAAGWLPLELPHGGRIERLVVAGQRAGTMTTFTVQVKRQAISAEPTPATEPLAILRLKDAPAGFLEAEDAGAPDVVDPTPELIAQRTRVDNTKFKYYLTASATGLAAGSKAQINSLQVIVTRV